MSPRLPSDVSLSRDARGATIIEFALIAPIFCTMALMIVQSGIAFQRWNALQTTARTTARCLAISSPRCTVASGGGSADPAIAYAVKVAAANGIGMVTAGMVRTETTADRRPDLQTGIDHAARDDPGNAGVAQRERSLSAILMARA